VKRLRERWRRLPRLARWPLALVGWIVVLRLALVPLVPFVAGWVARSHGLAVEWQSLSLTLRSGRLELRGLRLTPRGDGDANVAPWLTLERLHADVAMGDLLSGGGLRLQRLELDGLVLRVERRADGSIPWLEAFASKDEPKVEPEESGPLEPLELRAPLRIDHLRASQLVVQFEDAAVPGLGERRLVLGLRGDDIGYAERSGELKIEASSPGILEELEIDVSEHSDASAAAADLELALRGFDPTLLAAYLAPLGLAPDGKAIAGRAKLALELRPAAGNPHALALKLELRDCALQSEGAEAFGLERAKLALAELGAGTARGIGLEIAGVRVRARRSAAGELCLVGLRIIESPRADAAPAGSAPAPGAPLRWSLAGLALERAELELPQKVEVESLSLGAFDPESTNAKTGLELRAHAPGALRALTLHGSYERDGPKFSGELALSALGIELPQGPPLDIEGSGRVQLTRGADGVWTGSGSTEPQRAGFSGLRFDPAGPSLSIASLELGGLDARIAQAVLGPLGIEVGWKAAQLQAQLDAAIADGALSAHLRKLAFTDGESHYGSIDEISLEHWKLGAGMRELGAIRVRGVACEIGRDEQGALQAFGLRIGPQAAGTPVAEPTPPAELSFPLLPELGCAGIDVEGVRLHWTDRAQGRAVDCTLESQLHCAAFAPGQPLPYRVELHADALLESLALEGQLTLERERIALDGKIAARGLAPTFAGYLPPGIELRSASDVLTCGFHAQAQPASESGLRAKFELSGMSWGEAQQPARLSFERATLDLPRVSMQAIEIGELALRGLRVSAVKVSDGSLVVGGLHLVEAERPPVPTVETPPPATAAQLPPLPRISLGKLELELAGFELRDETLAAEAKPLVLAASLMTESPLVLADTAPEALPPLEFVLRGSASPLVPKFELRVALEQWLVQPHFELEFLAQGLRGAALVELDPGLAARIDGSGLEAGELEAHASGSFTFARRGLGRFDLGRPFAAELALEKLAFRASPGGEVLAGLERAEALIPRIDLRTGSVRAKSIELTRPILRAERTAEGLRICGLLLRNAPAAAAAPEVEPKAAAPKRAAEPLPEIGVTRISVNGLDVLYVDNSVDPPLRLPLVDLQCELRGLSTRALYERRSLVFESSLRAGPVPIAPHGRVKAPSERDAFTACDLSARVVLFPETAGRFHLGLEELQLVPFRPLIEAQGVHLEDGALGLTLGGKYSARDGLALDSVAVFSDLEISEKENGPLGSLLGLPMPLQATLALVRDLEGNVRIPTRIALEAGSVSKTQIVEALLASISSILSRAILSSPFRIVGGLAGSVGIHAGANGTPPEQIVLGFDEGSAQLEGLSERTRLQLAGKLSADDRVRIVLEHTFSEADLARARMLANPELDECRELSQRLRLKKAELARARAEGAAQVRVELAVGRTREARAGAERLREIDAELGRSEEALDHVHEFLADGAERRAATRLRTAARALANVRLERVRAALLGVGIDPARIELKTLRIEAGESPRGSVRVRLVRER